MNLNETVTKEQLLAIAEEQDLMDAKKFIQDMPSPYFRYTDIDDYRQHEIFLQRFRKNNQQSCLYHYKGDIEEFVFQEYNTAKLREQIALATKLLHANELLYRVFLNKMEGFMLGVFYKDIMLTKRAGEFNPPVYASLQHLFYNDDGKQKKHLINTFDDEQNTVLIRCINVAHKTMLGNLIETIEQHDLSADFIEVWRIKNVSAKVNVYYEIKIHFSQTIGKEEFESLNSDFERYIQQYTIPMSIFDLVGPSMVGPSSSHTAGANRIGQIARNIIMAKIAQGEIVESITIRLLGSFRDTGVGHKTPSALAGGLWGLATDDTSMIAHGEPAFLEQHGIEFGKHKATFNGFVKGNAENEKIYLSEHNSNIAEIIFSTGEATHTITGFSIGGGNVEIRYFDKALEKVINGKTDFYLDGNLITDKQNSLGNLPVIKSIYGSSSPETGYIMPFNTFEELMDYSAETGKSLIEIVLMVEKNLQSTSEEAIFDQMKKYCTIMFRSVEEGIKSKELSLLKLSGDGAFKINHYTNNNPLFNNLYGKAVAYATAVNELNAKSGVIVACPTAGSCGILPGALKSYSEICTTDEKKLLESLMIAGFLGMLLFNDVSTAGADYGCQAEVGSAAAMAAAALCYLENGNINQIVNAFTLAVKNSLGLICDPIAGLVEIPCVKRNGIYSSVAISAALMALSGVKSFVSPDEVILTMREVGERINSDYKETARGGLAKTRDGKHVEKMFETEVKKFFN